MNPSPQKLHLNGLSPETEIMLSHIWLKLLHLKSVYFDLYLLLRNNSTIGADCLMNFCPQILLIQESIPVGCVLPACPPYGASNQMSALVQREEVVQ